LQLSLLKLFLGKRHLPSQRDLIVQASNDSGSELGFQKVKDVGTVVVLATLNDDRPLRKDVLEPSHSLAHEEASGQFELTQRNALSPILSEGSADVLYDFGGRLGIPSRVGLRALGVCICSSFPLTDRHRVGRRILKPAWCRIDEATDCR
jgi:hypothetical protein